MSYGIFKGVCFCVMLYSFTYISAQSFRRVETQAGLLQLKHTMGVAVADYDLDHDLDLFVVAKYDFSPTDTTTWSRLFRNKGDGSFEDVSLAAGFGGLHDYGLEDPGWEFGVKMGASWGDYDNDGYPDLFLTNYHSVQLFHNEGNGSFSEVTRRAGFPPADSCYNTSALWWDMNQDGFLDLYISRWGGCAQNRFFQNNGDGTFTDRTHDTGLGGQHERSWMAVPIDANLDGLWDLYLANDFTENELLIQMPGFQFINQALQYQANYSGNDMGMAIGDYNNNGLFDIFITNIAENRLLTPRENGSYQNLADAMNVFDTYWAWGTQFADFDLDGDEDLFVSNGYQNDLIFYPSRKENFLFKNTFVEGGAIFRDWSARAGVNEYASSMSMRAFDYDLDGDLDILVSNMDDVPFFYQNATIEASHASAQSEEANWVGLQLEGTISNRDGLGSRITLWAGGQAQYRLYNGAGLFGQSLQGEHFGLGAASLIDSLEVSWDSGLSDRYYSLPANRYLRLKEQAGYSPVSLQVRQQPAPPSVLYPNPLSYGERVMLTQTPAGMKLKMYDAAGKEVAPQAIQYDELSQTTMLQINNLPRGIYFITSGKMSWKLWVK